MRVFSCGVIDPAQSALRGCHPQAAQMIRSQPAPLSRRPAVRCRVNSEPALVIARETPVVIADPDITPGVFAKGGRRDLRETIILVSKRMNRVRRPVPTAKRVAFGTD